MDHSEQFWVETTPLRKTWSDKPPNIDRGKRGFYNDEEDDDDDIGDDDDDD